MSHSQNAAISTCFTYVQFGLSLISGIILFPLVIKSVGGYSYGLWLATGESISYLLIGDLGVFTVLPWLISGRLGAQDFVSLRQHLSNAVAIGLVLGLMLFVVCGSLFLVKPESIGLSEKLRVQVLYPIAILLILNGASYPFKAFQAFLTGVQDVYFNGYTAIFQNLLLIVLTLSVIQFDAGVAGLALATGLPPLIGSLIAGIRVGYHHSHFLRGMDWPNYNGCRLLFSEGFGAWLAGLGVRLMTASNGIILASVGKPEWGTVCASTAKISQVLTPICSTIPDSGLVGISHLYATNDLNRTRKSVICLTLLYLVLPGFAAVGLLIANSAFVSWWIAPEMFAGNYMNTLLSITLVVSGLAGGSVKLAAVVGKRQLVGWATLVAGGVYIATGYWLVLMHGLVGLAEAGLLVWSMILLPVGLRLLMVLYKIRLTDLLVCGLGRWMVWSFPTFIVATLIGIHLSDKPLVALGACVIVVLLYAIMLRPLLQEIPWPARIEAVLVRFSLLSRPVNVD